MTEPDLARRRYLSLQRMARGTGQPTDALMSIYALEGFLARMAVSAYASNLVLKGGMLIAAFTDRRLTRDIDLQAIHLVNDDDVVREIVVEVASISVRTALSTTHRP